MRAVGSSVLIDWTSTDVEPSTTPAADVSLSQVVISSEAAKESANDPSQK